jgi:hypothetical protein
MFEFTEQELAESRARLDIPEDWEWYPCSAKCGDVVWVPPGTGDMGLRVVCSSECVQTVIAMFGKMDEEEQNLGEL